MPHPRPLLLIAALSALSHGSVLGAAPAQWGADPAVNQVVSSAPSDQNQPKLAATPDGGFWVSWLDGIGTGWDVRLQKLDAAGREAFGAGGLLVADRSFSSTQDYGLSVAENGDALLAFRDDRSGSVQITAARVDGAGAFPWGSAGVTLTSGGAFVAAPKVVESARSTAGHVVVAWIENSSVRLQALSAGGQPTWGSGVFMTPGAGNYGLADLERLGEDVVVSIVHQTGGFISPRHLVAQRLDPAGAPLWGSTPVTVFGAGSLQIGNFPPMLVAGGDAVFTWYSSSPSLQSFVQRLDGAGAPRFQANGLPVATTAGRERVNPAVAADEATGDLVVTWREQVPNSSLTGISAQRVSLTGARLWPAGGLPLLAVGSHGADFPGVQVSSDAALFTWLEAPTFGSDRLFGSSVDPAGAVVAPRFDVASTPSIKSRLARDVAGTGVGLLAWSDERSDSGDILVQALDLAGGLGAPGLLTTSTCAGVPNSTGASGELLAHGSAIAADNDVTLLATGLPPMAFGFFITSETAAASPVTPPSSQGTLCLGGSIGRYVGPGQVVSSGPSGVFSLALDLTRTPTPTGLVTVTAGQTRFFQGWYRDANPTVTSNFTSGLEVTFQ
ncbi:MAG: hypothetical protein PVJ89_08075 [Planctomycetota bacterium]